MKKTFDCVRMKWEIQEKQRRELAGVPEPQRRRALMDRVQADPILGPILRRLTTIPVTHE